MAYVVARPGHRFEIRESVHTPRGSRARSLVSFRVLTASVISRARERATRPFSELDVVSSAQRLQIPTEVGWDNARFVEAARRMSAELSRSDTESRSRRDPGASLLELLNFTDMIAESVGPRRWEPLSFPVLSRLGPPARA